MKKIPMISFLSFAVVVASAQNGSYWTIKHNTKTIRVISSENEEKNIITIKKSQFNKTGSFSLQYKKNGPGEKDWIRTMMIYDSTGNNQLWKKDSSALLLLTNTGMKTIFGNSNKIKIYTVAVPSDPQKAAVFRVRRIHLCTVVLK
jgi:hypothetical protein